MKKTFIKIISLVLVLCMTFPIVATATVGNDVTRVSVTINGDSSTARGFCWYTDEKAVSDLQVAPVGTDLTKAEIISGISYKAMKKYVHKAEAENLTPDTKYQYRVGDSETGVWSKIGYFTTASNTNDEANFIVFADVQASNEENFQSAAKVLQSAVNTMPDYEFAIGLGDFVNDCTNEEWDSYFRNFEFMNMNTTLVPVAGNHEGNLQWFKFNNMFNIGEAKGSPTITGCYYSFDWGDAHFAVLNSNDMYPMSASQINWLKNDMNASDAQWKIVLMHRALYSAGKNINKPDTIIMRNLLLPVIDELGIDVVFAGHDHMYMRTESVKDEKIQDYQTVTEVWNGESTTFALNPDGTTHILPSTAGTKRYGVNEDAIPPILQNSAVARDTHDGGVFATVSLDSEHFVYKAYMVDDETNEKTLIDSYAIKKTERNTVDEDYKELPTSILFTSGQHIITFIKGIISMVLSYFKLLFSLI
ncbi:MAG: metallophosphoesterase family protein [Clostridia bacterium]|nr:metallophosphoesterase family protein [Clostridia bacterium]